MKIDLVRSITNMSRGTFGSQICDSFWRKLITSSDSADKNEIAYYLGLCYAKLEKYDDALLFLEQVVTSGTDIHRILQCRFLLAVIYVISGRKRLADFELNKLLETVVSIPRFIENILVIPFEEMKILWE